MKSSRTSTRTSPVCHTFTLVSSGELFYDVAIVTLRNTEWQERRIINYEWFWRKWSWSDQGSIPALPLRDWGKTRKTSVTIASVPAETWTKHPPNTSRALPLYQVYVRPGEILAPLMEGPRPQCSEGGEGGLCLLAGYSVLLLSWRGSQIPRGPGEGPLRARL
jgi:hypothetical protein